jgi:hypothetical protein
MQLSNGMHIGKLPPRIDPRTLQFNRYRTGLPTPPDQIGHENLIAAANWGMLGNGPDNTVQPGFQGAGDCVFAGGDHETLLWTTEGGNPAEFNGKTAISDYSAVTGYVIGDPNTDVGTDVITALNYRRKTGLIDILGNRHKIGAYVALDVSKINAGDFSEFDEALFLFGAVAIGIRFPASAMTQFDNGQPWDVVADDGGIEGGHYIPAVEKYPDGTSDCVTWAKPQRVTAAFWSKYVDEAYAILSPEMLRQDKSPEGFDLAQLQTDLAEIDSANTAGPAVTGIDPSSGQAGSSVTITGSGFTGATQVLFGGVAANFSVGDDTAITAIVPAGTGTVDIAVYVSSIQSATGTADQFTYAVTPDPSKQIIGQVGNPVLQAFGKSITMDVAPVLLDIGGGGRVMVPVRFDAESRGDQVDWDEATKTFTITPAVDPATAAELETTKATLATTQAKLADVLSLLAKVKTDLGFPG